MPAARSVPRALTLDRSHGSGAAARLRPGGPRRTRARMYLLGQELQAWAQTGRIELRLDLPPDPHSI